MKALLSTIQNVQSDPDMNPSLKIAGIIAMIYEQRVRVQHDVWDLLHELNIPFLGTIKKFADTPRIGEQEVIETKTAVNAFKSNLEKNKMISAHINIDRYEKFTAINKKRGISNNKILNLMIPTTFLNTKNYYNFLC